MLNFMQMRYATQFWLDEIRPVIASYRTAMNHVGEQRALYTLQKISKKIQIEIKNSILSLLS